MSSSLERTGSVATIERTRHRALKALVSAALVAASLAIGVPGAHAVTPGYIDTFAGNGVAPGPSDATDLGFRPAGLVAADGAVYVSDQMYSVVRKVDATGSQVIIAGTGSVGYDGDGVAATATRLNYPSALAVDSAGNLFIADQYNHRVRVVPAASGTLFGQEMTAGNIYTVAGTGILSYSGDGGPATAAALAYPRGLAFDADGNLFITTDQRVRVVAATAGTRFGQEMTSGNIYTVAGTGVYGWDGDGVLATATRLFNPAGVVADGNGNVLVADQANNRVRVVAATSGTFYGQAMTAGYIATILGTGSGWDTGDGGSAAAATVAGPFGLAFDAGSNLVITTTWGHRVRMVAAADTTMFGQEMTAGYVYTIAGTGAAGFSGDGALATAAQLFEPTAATVDSGGNVVFVDENNLRVRLVAAATGTFYGHSATANAIVTVVGNGTRSSGGNGGPAAAAQLEGPQGLVVDGAGNVTFADANDRVWMVAATNGTYYGQPMTAGSIYAIAGSGTGGDSGDDGPATDAQLNQPTGVALDGAGNLFIADSSNYRVRVVAATNGTFYGRTMTAGNIYAIAGTGDYGYSGDGGPATAAALDDPQGVAVDSDGNVVLTDSANAVVRVVAGSNGTFYDQAMTAGYIYTIAGTGTAGYNGDGPATAAQLSYPYGVRIDDDGNLVVADQGNHRVRVLAASTGTFYDQAMTAGNLHTIVGTGTQGYSGDGGAATAAELDYPTGVGFDGAGNLYVADGGNDAVRMVAAASGTVNGRSVTTGHIYTVAGTGSRGFSGDGGPATSARLDGPEDVALNAAGDLFIADSDNHRVRVVYAPPTPTTVPSAPTMLTPTFGSQTITLSWTAPSDDGGLPASLQYEVYLATTPGGQDYEGAAAAVVYPPATGTTVSGLVNGTTYYVTVLAWNDIGYSVPSNEVSATPTGTVPGAPAMYSPTAGNQTVDLSWTWPTSDGGSPIDEYRVYQGTSAGGEDYDTPVAVVDGGYDWATISGLTNHTTYYFTVKAHNLYGEGAASGEVSATPVPDPPGAPTDLTLTAVADGAITLHWTAPTSDGGAAIDEYRVYQDGTLIATLGGTATSATVSGLTNGEESRYTVRAHNSGGEGSSSNGVYATAGAPTAPTSLAASAGRNQVTLSWTDHGSLITSHAVQVYAYVKATRRTPADYVAVGGPHTVSGTSITVTGLAGGKTRYVFTVSATNMAGTSTVSAYSAAFGIKGGPL